MTLRYIFLSFCSVILTLIAKLFARQIAKYVDVHGDLPVSLSYFQPADTKCFGDQSFWQNEMPATKDNMGTIWYERSCAWLARNPAQGFDMLCAADEWVLSELAMVKVEGDIDITAGMEVAIDGKTRIHGKTGWHKVSIGKFWHYRNINAWPFGIYTSSEFGWRLQGIAQGRPQDICRQLVFTPIRIIKFVRPL
jgi:hypothetical protein